LNIYIKSGNPHSPCQVPSLTHKHENSRYPPLQKLFHILQGRRSYLSTPQPQPQPSEEKNLHSHGLPKRARDVPNPFNRAPNPLRTNHPIPSHPPFTHSPNPTLSRTPPPQNHKTPSYKRKLFSKHNNTFHAENSPLQPGI